MLLEAADVDSLLKRLDVAFPGLRDRVIDEAGHVRPYVNLFLNDDLIHSSPEETPLHSGDVVHILPSVAGGSDG